MGSSRTPTRKVFSIHPVFRLSPLRRRQAAIWERRSVRLISAPVHTAVFRLFFRVRPFERMRPFFRFFRSYILKGGFRDGVPGFVHAVWEGIYQFTIVAKMIEFRRKAKN